MLIAAIAAGGWAWSRHATSDRVSIALAGDFGASDRTASVLQGMRAAGVDATFAVGDLSYGVTGEESSWCSFVTRHLGPDIPFELLSGNHESNDVNGSIDAFARCLPNRLDGLVGTYGREYYLDLPRDKPVVRLVMISPQLTFPEGTWSYAVGSPRAAWTTAAISSARAAGLWTVVGMHIPCLNAGTRSCEVGADVLNLLVAAGADLVVSGHEHTYQRTFPLAQGADCPTLVPGTYNRRCVASTSETSRQGSGTTFVTVGTGGADLYAVKTDDPEGPYFAAISGRNLRPTWGFLALDIATDRLSARFVPTAGDGFTDAFTVTRGT